MTDCPLTPDRLSRLLGQQLSAAEKALLRDHLAADCPECERVLDEAELDEETLLLALCTADQASLRSDQLERSWQVISRRLEAPFAERAPARRRWAWAWGGGGLSLAAAAAVILFWITPPGDGQRVKGTAPVPRASLALVAPDRTADTWLEGDRVAVQYGLERAAHAVIFHQRPGGPLDMLFAGSLAAATSDRGSVAMGAGQLGYDFGGEPGAHWFVMVVSDGDVPSAECRQVVAETIQAGQRGWSEHPGADGAVLGVFVRRVMVAPEEVAP